ncbi:type II secretion system protein L [Tepidimonas taiwanensis]|uniref:Type II secretion system protein L n=2 Tax=Tepidimonas taiwanensis TaxID=307486 RepID=A0A554X370_9BURK|nr:type II secretion system protein GspL [Tepidimonas taiwanensis]MCX7693045.1 type II secretion system protein GspL [Tepidimonas taiwanensis]TSE30289.1 type II secretion system protein L [Tepidimonas taiwanensis]
MPPVAFTAPPMLLLCPQFAVASDASHGARGADLSHWRWARSTDGQTIDASGIVGRTELDALSPAEGCVLVWPLQAVSWHRVRLPAGRAARSAAVIAGLLEDAVLDDPAALHVALEPAARRRREAGEVWVAVCHREALESALAPLLQQGWAVQAIVPEVAPQPQELAWAHAIDEIPHLTLAGPHGVLTQRLMPGGMPGGMADALAGDDSPPSAWADATTIQEAQRHLPDWPWQVVPAGHVWLHTLAQGWNLAQFDLAARVGGVGWHRLQSAVRAVWYRPEWRAARWGLAASVALPLVALPALAWQQRQQEQALRAALLHTARQALPDTPVLLDPVRQVQQALARERARAGDVPPALLERVLHAWGSADGLPPLRALQADDAGVRIDTDPGLGADRLAAAIAPHGLVARPGLPGQWTLTPAREGGR